MHVYYHTVFLFLPVQLDCKDRNHRLYSDSCSTNTVLLVAPRGARLRGITGHEPDVVRGDRSETASQWDLISIETYGSFRRIHVDENRVVIESIVKKPVPPCSVNFVARRLRLSRQEFVWLNPNPALDGKKS